MLDVGWSELLLIGVVALIVVGPQDLPKLFSALGRLTAKARGMAREFSSAMEDAAKSSGVDDVSRTLRDAGSLTSASRGVDALDRAVTKFEKWDPKLPTAKPALAPDPAAPSGDAAPAAVPPIHAAAPAAASAAPALSGQPVGAAPAMPPADGRRRIAAVRRKAPAASSVQDLD